MTTDFETIVSQSSESELYDYAQTLQVEQFAAFLEFLADRYYNDESLVSDHTYDTLLDMYQSKYGKYTSVGAEPDTLDDLVDLPYYMGSLDKLKTEQQINNWISKNPGPYVIEDKIDGMSVMLQSDGHRLQLFSRGKGYRGRNLSHLIPHLQLPPINDIVVIRGELVISNENFALYADKFKNARNMAGGIMSAKKSFDPKMAQLFSFIPYKVMSLNLTPLEDIAILQNYGFELPAPVYSEEIDYTMLKEHLEERQAQAPYYMDGIVIYSNQAIPYPTGSDPKHVIAFKIPTETAVTTVTKVVWRGSKGNLLKPTVWYTPVTLSGATLERASGYNARYIVNNNIGVGAVITITRSGDVIPKITNVLKPATEPDLPLDRHYQWNENEVEFILTDDEVDDEVLVGKLKHFFTTMGIKNIGPARIAVLVQGGLHSLRDILDASDEFLTSLPGLGKTFVSNLRTGFANQTRNVPLSRVMDASGIFPGIGERRFDVILKAHPNLLELNNVEPLIKELSGFNVLAQVIEDNLDAFIAWLELYPEIKYTTPMMTTTSKTTSKTLTMDGLVVVFSGFRDKNLETVIVEHGGRVASTVTKQTNILIVANSDETSTKVTKAQSYKITILTKTEFVEQYGL